MADSHYTRVFGHEEIRQRLAHAGADGRFPQSLLLYGPGGVGKQRIALWAAALLNCAGVGARPCGTCRSCRLAGRLEHPDIHWFFPLPRPKRAGSPEKLIEKLEESRAAVLAERRENHLYTDDWEEVTGIYLAAVRVMRHLAQNSPAMGPRKVLVLGHAEALVPQMGNPEAGNALLKLLEEPPADTTLILTSNVPGALLPTIRSRVQAIRIAPLPDDRVRDFLESELELPAESARVLATRSAGSIGRALRLHGEEHESDRESAVELVRAALLGRASARYSAAHGYRAFGARGGFGRVLSETRSLLHDLLAAATGADSAIAERETLRHFPSDGLIPSQLVRALEAVEEAQGLADRNVNPQLIVVNLIQRMSVTHRGTAGRAS